MQIEAGSYASNFKELSDCRDGNGFRRVEESLNTSTGAVIVEVGLELSEVEASELVMLGTISLKSIVPPLLLDPNP